MSKKKHRSKQRTDFRKNHQGRVRQSDLTRDFKSGKELSDLSHGERVSGKGDLTRKRTVDASSDGPSAVGEKDLLSGRVVSAHGLKCKVISESGQMFDCAIRQVLKSLSIDQRGAVVAGDHVRFRAESPQDGMIEQVLPRRGIISRT